MIIKYVLATLSEPKGVGITVAVVAITAAAVNGLILDFISTGYNVANNIIAKLEALGITNDNRFPNKNTIGTKKYADLTCFNGLVNTFTVTSFAPI